MRQKAQVHDLPLELFESLASPLTDAALSSLEAWRLDELNLDFFSLPIGRCCRRGGGGGMVCESSG